MRREKLKLSKEYSDFENDWESEQDLTLNDWIRMWGDNDQLDNSEGD